MRIFVSSSFEDLKDHRAYAIRVLRQLGHEVIAMEDMTAGATAPLAKVLEMVDRSEAYVGIFAWRYGYVSNTAANAPAPVALPAPADVPGALPGETSITHFEYLRARQRGLPIMAFLLDERWPWPPEFVDGFDQTRAGSQPNPERIRKLRLALQQERVVSWFTTPADLEARVSAAVTTQGLSSQLDLQEAIGLPPGFGAATEDTSAEAGIANAILSAGDQQRALKIDLATVWWSTRLFLIASLAERLTQARRVLVVETSMRPNAAVSGPPEERFVGQLSTSAILSVIRSKTPQLASFEDGLRLRGSAYDHADVELREIFTFWRSSFPAGEAAAAVVLDAGIMRRWFREMMLTQPLEIADLRKASAVDILRLLDYPSDFVPVLTRPDAAQAARSVGVVDKAALNARLSRSYLVELLDRARISLSGGQPGRV